MEKTHEKLTQLYLDYVNNYTEFLDRPTKVKKIYLRRVLKQIRNISNQLKDEISAWHDVNKIYDRRKDNFLKQRYSRPKKNPSSTDT
jgi:hypothetical protein